MESVGLLSYYLQEFSYIFHISLFNIRNVAIRKYKIVDSEGVQGICNIISYQTIVNLWFLFQILAL